VTVRIPLRPKLARKARLRWDRRDQRTMLLYPERGLALNDTAAAIARLCDGTRTVDDIVEALRAGVSDAPPSLPADVATFLAELATRGLLEPGEG
jgi:coenzyme PQQ biosynthesis protein PqqD